MNTIPSLPIEQNNSNEKLKNIFAYLLFACGIFLYVLVHFHRNCIPGQIYNDLSGDLNLTAAQMANIAASLMYMYAFMQLANGLLVDKFGGCRILMYGSLLTLVGTWLFVVTSQYWILIVSRILTGLGVGSTYLAMLDITKWRFPKTFNIMTGFFIGVGQLGGALGTAPFASCCQAFGWLSCLKTIAIITTLFVLLVVICFFIVDKQPVAKTPIRLRVFLTILFNKYNLLNNLSFNFSYGAFYAFFSLIMKKFLQDCYGMGSAAASSVSCSMLIMQAIFNQTYGILMAKYFRSSKTYFNWLMVVPFVGTLLVLAFLALDFSSSKILIIITLNIMGMIAGCTPVSLEITRNVNPPELVSSSIGFNNSLAYIFSAIFTSMTGFILGFFAKGPSAEQVYSPTAYMVLLAVNACILFIPIVMARFIPDHHGKNIYKPSCQLFGIGKLK